MTFTEAVAELWAKHPKAELSPSVKRGTAFVRAARIDFTPDKGGLYAGTDADGIEVQVYFNDTANVISCTESNPTSAPTRSRCDDRADGRLTPSLAQLLPPPTAGE